MALAADGAARGTHVGGSSIEDGRRSGLSRLLQLNAVAAYTNLWAWVRSRRTTRWPSVTLDWNVWSWARETTSGRPRAGDAGAGAAEAVAT
jgi:hypothetical protein